MRNRLHPRSGRVKFGALVLLSAALTATLGGCGRAAQTSQSATSSWVGTPREVAFLDTLAERTFDFFWELSDPETGLTPDRAPAESFISVAAVGFALTAYPIGVERGYVPRAEAADRVRNTLQFFWNAPQGDAPSGMTGHHGFFYHFLHADTGRRFEEVELSTIDTALFLGGALFCQSYFDRPEERDIRALADSIYARVDWNWAQPRPPGVALGWSPEGGFLPWDWGGYNEAMLLYVLALGSPTHPVEPEAWTAWTSRYHWDSYYGEEHVAFAPLFGHQYSHVWIDFRGIQDAYMRDKGIDYFENSRRATLSQQRYAIDNPAQYAGYGPLCWGLTACDGPIEGAHGIDGRERQFHTYLARGAAAYGVQDDGTICPSAAGGSIAFAPEIVVPTLMSMREIYGRRLFGQYGFLDAFNPTLKLPIDTQHGEVDPILGWFDTDYLGIDQGPILAMLQNLQTELVWKEMSENPHLVRGLRRAGFSGGWLDR